MAATSAIRILIVDDHVIVRKGLRDVLALRPDWIVCGEAEDGIEAVEKARELNPDLVLMDVNMPRMNGLEASRAIRNELPDVQVLLVSQNEPSVLNAQAKQVNALGFVTKANLSHELLNKIEGIPLGKSLNTSVEASLPGLLSKTDISTRVAPDLSWLNRRLRDLLMQAPSAIGITVGPEHRWAYVNIERARMAGRKSADEFIGKPVRASYPELEGQPFFAALDEVYRSGIPFVGKEIKATFNRGPGGSPEVAYVDCVYQPIQNAVGEVEGLLIHTVEVTEQVLARRLIEAANAREREQRSAVEFERNQLRELFKQAPAGIAILTGPEHRWSFANRAYGEIVGAPWEDLIGRPIRETLPELEGQGFFELLDDVFQSGTAFVGENMKAVLHRGTEDIPEDAYFDFIYQPIRNVHGEIEGLMVLAVEVTQQQQMRSRLERRVQERTADLEAAQESLRLLSGNLMHAQDEERRRVARELHDSAGQYLAAIQMNLSTMIGQSGLPSDVVARLNDSMGLIQLCTAEIRTLSYLLHPPLLDETGLASAISWYVEGFSERSGIEVVLDIPCDLPRFCSDSETALFRIVQQSLANIHRHSGSKLARIVISVKDDRLFATITDQGHGIAPEILSQFKKSGQVRGVGLSGMRERINAMGGTFDIASTHQGTVIDVSLPAERPHS